MNRVEELNERIVERNKGETPQFYFSPRPVPTKYTTMPILDEKLPATIPLKNELVFDVTKQFLPGSSAPWSGRIDQIDADAVIAYDGNRLGYIDLRSGQTDTSV